MTTAARGKPTPAAAPEVECITAPEYAGRPGVVLINGQHYLLTCWGEGPADGYRLARLDGEAEAYDLHVACYGDLACDCPGATYRQRQCKRSLALCRLHKAGVI